MSLRADLSAGPRRKVARAGLRGEGVSKILGDRSLGPVIARAFALAGLTSDQAAREMGYADATTVAKWIGNTEPPQIARIWSVRQLRVGLLVALAEHADEQVEVRTTVTVRRQA